MLSEVRDIVKDNEEVLKKESPWGHVWQKHSHEALKYYVLKFVLKTSCQNLSQGYYHFHYSQPRMKLI